MSCHTCNRREFLTQSLVGVATIGGLAILGNGCTTAVVPPLVDAVVSDDGKVRLLLSSYPDLALANGAVTLHLDGTDSRRDLLLIHANDDQWVSLDAICTHANCPLGYDKNTELVECPCHGSTFDLTGVVKHGPAKGALNTYPTSFDGSIITIDFNDGPSVSNGLITFPAANYSQLATNGGFVVISPIGLNDRLIVVRTGDTSVNVTSSVCTHLGCDVAFNAKSDQLDCPCHGSIFALDGTVVQGPAALALQDYTATFDGVTINITVS